MKYSLDSEIQRGMFGVKKIIIIKEMKCYMENESL